MDNTYNYLVAVKDDVLDAISANYTVEQIAEQLADRGAFEEELNDRLWTDDSVTGNGSGSYTFSREKAKEYVLADVDTVLEAVREFCCGMDAAELLQKCFDGDWEYFDVTARCYVLGQAIDAALDEMEVK